MPSWTACTGVPSAGRDLDAVGRAGGRRRARPKRCRSGPVAGQSSSPRNARERKAGGRSGCGAGARRQLAQRAPAAAAGLLMQLAGQLRVQIAAPVDVLDERVMRSATARRAAACARSAAARSAACCPRRSSSGDPRRAVRSSTRRCDARRSAHDRGWRWLPPSATPGRRSARPSSTAAAGGSRPARACRARRAAHAAPARSACSSAASRGSSALSDVSSAARGAASASACRSSSSLICRSSSSRRRSPSSVRASDARRSASWLRACRRSAASSRRAPRCGRGRPAARRWTPQPIAGERPRGASQIVRRRKIITSGREDPRHRHGASPRRPRDQRSDGHAGAPADDADDRRHVGVGPRGERGRTTRRPKQTDWVRLSSACRPGSTVLPPSRPRKSRPSSTQLRTRITIPVHQEDERLTSREAESRLARRERDWRKRKAQLDAAAAAIILQDYLDRHGG